MGLDSHSSLLFSVYLRNYSDPPDFIDTSFTSFSVSGSLIATDRTLVVSGFKSPSILDYEGQRA